MNHLNSIACTFFICFCFQTLFSSEYISFETSFPDGISTENQATTIQNSETTLSVHQGNDLIENTSYLPEFKKSSKKKKTQKLLGSLVVSTKKINIPGFENAFNPSIVEYEDEYLLTFRYCPDESAPWISYIGIVRMDKSFNLVSTPQLLNSRVGLPNESPSQAEDARIFSHKDEIYIIYNDNDEITNPKNTQRRDMYIAKIFTNEGVFSISSFIKLKHEEKYNSTLWQKNWTPFVWQDHIMLSYTLKPHEVLLANLEDGICKPCYNTKKFSNWLHGEPRGGTPAILVNGEYLAFFHSSRQTKSKESQNKTMYHYYMGAYVFSRNPPFEITRMTPNPIIGKNFYTVSNFHKRVVFPGGFVVDANKIHVVYGKDDSEIWVATIDKSKLYQTLLPIK